MRPPAASALLFRRSRSNRIDGDRYCVRRVMRRQRLPNCELLAAAFASFSRPRARVARLHLEISTIELLSRDRWADGSANNGDGVCVRDARKPHVLVDESKGPMLVSSFLSEWWCRGMYKHTRGLFQSNYSCCGDRAYYLRVVL